MTTAGLPPSGLAVHSAVTTAVAAAAAHDPAALRDACARLRTCEEQQVRDVLHALTLGLIEKTFPAGLDADDLRALLADVMHAATTWFPDLDPHAVVLVLTGALSVHETDAPPVDADALPIACALAVSHLVHQLRIPLELELTHAFDELRRAQTMEMP
ncbi:hypothetical protein [Protofrankia symbiont of Coriaria ruscifolia]|uniref:Uncharacterized protein n=1 Tax=Candidatus Protofrankia californiensis TaxID=1839754 RepID=A0A1C3P1P6_9ACTN|nr:hypothetical protein [Protofrankia symbiont of Coriaria ruscifolia]SBW23648.1 hypothetical protein FDG2_3869 [Candidatus Protofrankia californiensis]